jgi:hypothetical protein
LLTAVRAQPVVPEIAIWPPPPAAVNDMLTGDSEKVHCAAAGIAQNEPNARAKIRRLTAQVIKDTRISAELKEVKP